jgi:hypothetical protein
MYSRLMPPATTSPFDLAPIGNRSDTLFGRDVMPTCPPQSRVSYYLLHPASRSERSTQIESSSKAATMIKGTASMLRPSLRSASRLHFVPSQLSRSVGRRGYATLQERIGQSRDTPWQIAAVAVTVPGLLYLRSSGGTAQPRHGEAYVKRLEPAREKVSESAANVTSAAKAKMEEAQETVQQTLSSALESSSSSSESEATPASSSSASAQSTQTQMDDSQESQAQKLTEKQASQRVDPTEK